MAVPLDLARRRAGSISNVRYDLHFTVADEIRGRVVVRFDLSSDETVLIDWRGGHLAVDGRRGANEWTHEFVAGDSIHREPDFVYTLFVPDRASRAFPCFDQPDLKAEFSLTLDLPDGWAATQTTRAKLPTYLFAFAAGRFDVVEDPRGYRMFHRESDAAKVALNAPAIFDLHDAARRWMEAYTQFPCPFGRDIVLLPGFPYRGMEHPGCIFYRDTVLLLDEAPTPDDVLGRASTIAHETAHLWFGDLVTMRWFDDVWTKESFADFMADKIVAERFPHLDLRFFVENYPGAAAVDRSRGTHALHQPLDNLADAGSLYGALIYRKSPIVLRQLELVAGEEAFRDGLREHLRAHAFGNASWPELVAVLGRHTPADLDAFGRAWVYEPGRPTIRVEGRAAIVSDPPRPQRVEVWSGSAVRSVLLTDRVEIGGDAPYVVPIGYGRIVLDERSLAYARANLPDIGPPLVRAVLVETLWEDFLHGGDRVADVFLRTLRAEPNEPIVRLLLSKFEELVRRYDEPTAELEGLLYGSDPAKFRVWWKIVASPEGVRRLESVWREPPIPLSERDLSDIALTLAVRGVDVLDEQAARLADPERARRFAFVRRAIDDPGGFFASLRDAAGRRPEPWVLEGLTLLHHPSRADEGRILPSLELLDEIQRTGDIFFPHGWIEATLAGHRTASAAKIVEEFLAARPDYPPRLRLKILQAADGLFRAAGLERRVPPRYPLGMSTVTKRKKTVEEYLALPDDVRAELFGGELYMSPAPKYRHQRIIARLMGFLVPFVEHHRLGTVVAAPFDVVLSDDDVVQPDIVFVATAHLSRINDRLYGPPDLAIEVLSESNAERDRIVKRDLYLKHGVPEYWIVDSETSTIEVRRLRADDWDLAAIGRAGDSIETALLPGLKLDIGAVFA